MLISAFSESYSQQKNAQKVHDVFMTYVADKLALTPQESNQMRPLVVHYFSDMRKILRENTDPLVREQQRIDLKIKYRAFFQPIIGQTRSNRFFVEEQLFRKKVRDELKQRKTSKKS